MHSSLFCWYVVRTHKINPFFLFVISLFVSVDVLYYYINDEKYIWSIFFLVNLGLIYFLTSTIKRSVNISEKVIYSFIIVFLVALLIGVLLSSYYIITIFFVLSLLLPFFIALYYYKYEVKESSFLILASVGVLIVYYSFLALNLMISNYINYVAIQLIAYVLFLFLITKSIIEEDKYDLKLSKEDKYFLNKNLSITFFIVFSIVYTYLRLENNTSFIMYLVKSFLIIIMFLIYTFTFTLSILISLSLKYLFENKSKVALYLFLSITTLALCYVFSVWVRLVKPNLLFVSLEAILYCLELYFLTEFFITENKELKLKEGLEKKELSKTYS